MAKKLGNNIRLFVPVADTPTAPLGQGNLTINRNQGSFSIGSKEDYPFDPNAPSTKAVSITQAIIPNLPDPAYAALKALDASGAPAVMEVHDISIDDEEDTVMFQCLMYVSFGNTDANQNAAVGTSLTLTIAAPPTIDLL